MSHFESYRENFGKNLAIKGVLLMSFEGPSKYFKGVYFSAPSMSKMKAWKVEGSQIDKKKNPQNLEKGAAW